LTTKKTTTKPAPARKRPTKAASNASEDKSAKTPQRPRLQVSHARAATPPRRAPVKASIPPPAGAVPDRVRKPRKAATAPATGSAQIALAVATAALEKKASDIEIIDLAGKADYTDYLVLMTGGSDRHVRALADFIQEELEKRKVKALSVEGVTAANWILLDFGDVVAHVFQESTRALYDIEGLWLDAARVPIAD